MAETIGRARSKAESATVSFGARNIFAQSTPKSAQKTGKQNQKLSSMNKSTAHTPTTALTKSTTEKISSASGEVKRPKLKNTEEILANRAKVTQPANKLSGMRTQRFSVKVRGNLSVNSFILLSAPREQKTMKARTKTVGHEKVTS